MVKDWPMISFLAWALHRMQFCVGSPLVTKSVCGQVIYFWIAHAVAECIAASLSMDRLASRKGVRTATQCSLYTVINVTTNNLSVHVVNEYHKLNDNVSYCLVSITDVYWLL
jgi:hypothetical protein